MLIRLRDVPYWAGCVLGVVLVIASASGDRLGAGLIVGALAFGIGWAARSVLSGKRSIF